MGKVPCVFPKEENRNMGDRVFFFEKAEENDDFGRLYEFEDDEKWTMILHKSKIKTVERSMIELKFGANYYLKDEYSQFTLK